MNYAGQIVADAGPGVARADSAAGLRRFLAPHCAAALWARQMPQDVGTWLDALDPDALPRGRIAVPIGGVAGAFGQMCAEAALPDSP